MVEESALRQGSALMVRSEKSAALDRQKKQKLAHVRLLNIVQAGCKLVVAVLWSRTQII